MLVTTQDLRLELGVLEQDRFEIDALGLLIGVHPDKVGVALIVTVANTGQVSLNA